MANRFGRNQKRRMREELAQANKQAQEAALSLQAAEARLRGQAALIGDARQRAFDEFIAISGIYKHACDRMAAEMGRTLGEELTKHMIDAGINVPPPLLSLEFDFNRQMDIVTVRVPAFEIRRIVDKRWS